MSPPTDNKRPPHAAHSHPVVVFADGACSGNPGPGGWGVVIATPHGDVVELGGRQSDTTNNRMELTATIRALRWIEEHAADIERIDAYTDSTYVIRGITQWIWAWRKSGWKTKENGDVINQDLWKALSILVSRCKIDWKYVRGHTGVPGNERVDEIAVAFTRGQRPALFSGSLLKYPIAIHDLPESTALPESRPIGEVRDKKPHSYLSLVNGVPMRHSTWAECESRVKGRPAAKFKKAMSPADEAEILRSWGVDLGKLP